MSTEYWIRGTLTFADADAIAAAKQALTDDGYDAHEDNALYAASLVWSGTTVRIAQRGWMPHLCVDITKGALGTWARHAASGEVVMLLPEDGYGERLRAGDGDGDDEIEPDDVDALFETWKREAGP